MRVNQTSLGFQVESMRRAFRTVYECRTRAIDHWFNGVGNSMAWTKDGRLETWDPEAKQRQKKVAQKMKTGYKPAKDFVPDGFRVQGIDSQSAVMTVPLNVKPDYLEGVMEAIRLAENYPGYDERTTRRNYKWCGLARRRLVAMKLIPKDELAQPPLEPVLTIARQYDWKAANDRHKTKAGLLRLLQKKRGQRKKALAIWKKL